MKSWRAILVSAVAVGAMVLASSAAAQESKAAASKAGDSPAAHEATAGREYSGMYSFLKDGEFVQITVEDAGRVTGFVSRYGEGESDKGAFLDQYFRSGKLDGNKLSFTTETVHAVWFEFRGTVERGEGKNPGDEGYYALKGTLIENTSDAEKKVTSHEQEVALKIFPRN
jgi:opacity protein-like surface antigen